jgi:hypothetical protein
MMTCCNKDLVVVNLRMCAPAFTNSLVLEHMRTASSAVRSVSVMRVQLGDVQHCAACLDHEHVVYGSQG